LRERVGVRGVQARSQNPSFSLTLALSRRERESATGREHPLQIQDITAQEP
jgi:hypothetical protein